MTACPGLTHFADHFTDHFTDHFADHFADHFTDVEGLADPDGPLSRTALARRGMD